MLLDLLLVEAGTADQAVDLVVVTSEEMALSVEVLQITTVQETAVVVDMEARVGMLVEGMVLGSRVLGIDFLLFIALHTILGIGVDAPTG